ncbi:uncharacterized protein LOC111627556 [Centruroides sculpturatus]|uniref:uncharacterized protein LOC111627556 n=1 Tax=Centruroides sculpturatus TaxID=218467 RepID=UPI000C6EE514|nr:uncharacterized protein LOC111627556 [Centruroides sculpturatus]
MNNEKFWLLWWGVACLLGAEASYNESICTFETFNCGPIPPTIKESFILKGEYIDFDSQTTTWQEEYFDYPNLIAKYKIVAEGMELHHIFDYEQEEVIVYQVIHPGAPAEKDPTAIRTCKVIDLESSGLGGIYGYLYKQQSVKRSRMYDSSQVLHFGGEYKYAFVKNSTLKERQIPHLEYHGCVYDKNFDMTMDKTFLWSRDDVVIASGEDTMPIKANTLGVRTTYNDDGKPETESFNYTENFVWYQGNPDFDEDTFWIPRRMYCEDLRSKINEPNFPTAFSARLEETVMKYDVDGNLKDMGFVWNNETWYDSDENVIRMDFVLSEKDGEVFKVFGKTPISAIFDVTQGVVYYISRVSGICVPFAIPADSIVISSDFERKMASIEEILGLNGLDMEYKGKNRARQILCDVWAGENEDDENTTIFTEFYTSANGWHSESEEDEVFDVPVRITQSIFRTVEDQTNETVREINIFDFKDTKPSFTVFDITNCLISQDHLFLSFSIEKNYAEIVESYNEQKFIAAIRKSIADFSHIGSTILVQDIEIFESRKNDRIRVDFLLMDQPKLYGKSKKQPGTSLNVAYNNLKSAINSGSFIILVVVDGVTGADTIKAIPNSLVKLLQHSQPLEESAHYSGIDLIDPYGSEEQEAEPKPTKKHIIDKIKDFISVKRAGDVETNKDKTEFPGYSSGLLAGVGIIMLAVGIALGIGLMYLYLKKYGRTQDGNSLVLQER